MYWAAGKTILRSAAGLPWEEIDPASLHNFPVIGYKQMGAGKVVYLGMEYYQEQSEPSRILMNTIRWAATQSKAGVSGRLTGHVHLNRAAKRSEEVLHAGSGPAKTEVFDLKIYPNPYFEKATLDFELKNAATVEAEMTDESGRIAAVLLPQKNLAAGFYRSEIPNVSPGVYFVRCKTGDKTTVRKVVKTTTP